MLPTNATIDQAISVLNSVVGPGSFSKDTTGTKIVMNASADVEFATSTDQTKLGFTAGTGTGASYGSTSAAPQSSDLIVNGVSGRAALASQFNSLLTQIDQLATDASYNGVNLIAGKGTNNNLTINFNPKGNSSLIVQSTDETSNGLGLASITSTSAGTGGLYGQGNFLLNTDINNTLTSLTKASNQLRTDSSTFGSNLSVVQNRQDFTKNLVNVLDTGSANLTNADLNAEAANSQALSTRQSLGIPPCRSPTKRSRASSSFCGKRPKGRRSGTRRNTSRRSGPKKLRYIPVTMRARVAQAPPRSTFRVPKDGSEYSR